MGPCQGGVGRAAGGEWETITYLAQTQIMEMEYFLREAFKNVLADFVR